MTCHNFLRAFNYFILLRKKPEVLNLEKQILCVDGTILLRTVLFILNKTKHTFSLRQYNNG